MAHLNVSYDCSGCGEAAESDGDFGLICRRCSLVFSDWSDGSSAEKLQPGEFVDYYGNDKPKPSRREALDQLLGRRRAA